MVGPFELVGSFEMVGQFKPVGPFDSGWVDLNRLGPI